MFPLADGSDGNDTASASGLRQKCSTRYSTRERYFRVPTEIISPGAFHTALPTRYKDRATPRTITARNPPGIMWQATCPIRRPTQHGTQGLGLAEWVPSREHHTWNGNIHGTVRGISHSGGHEEREGGVICCLHCRIIRSHIHSHPEAESTLVLLRDAVYILASFGLSLVVSQKKWKMWPCTLCPHLWCSCSSFGFVVRACVGKEVGRRCQTGFPQYAIM